MAGLVVAVPDPPVADTPVIDGIEKKVFSQAAGDVVAIEASLVKVTVSGLPVVAFAPTTSGVVSVCELPLVDVA